MTTENLKNTMATVDAMKIAGKEMKKQYKNLDIDKIESIHYDMEDLMEQANDIQETLGRSYGVPEEVDEADLEAGERIHFLPFLPSSSTNHPNHLSRSPRGTSTELEALGDDFLEEEEVPSYLKDTTALPDFVDDAPVEADKVSGF